MRSTLSAELPRGANIRNNRKEIVVVVQSCPRMLKVRNIHLTWASRSRHATSSTRSARKDCTDLRLEPFPFAKLHRNHRKGSLCFSIVSRFFLHLHVLLPINVFFCKFQAEIVHLTMAGFWFSKSWSPPRRHRIPARLSEERSNTSRCCCWLKVLWMAIPKVLAGWESPGISQLLACKPWEVWIKLCYSAVLSLQHLAVLCIVLCRPGVWTCVLHLSLLSKLFLSFAFFSLLCSFGFGFSLLLFANL